MPFDILYPLAKQTIHSPSRFELSSTSYLPNCHLYSAARRVWSILFHLTFTSSKKSKTTRLFLLFFREVPSLLALCFSEKAYGLKIIFWKFHEWDFTSLLRRNKIMGCSSLLSRALISAARRIASANIFRPVSPKLKTSDFPSYSPYFTPPISNWIENNLAGTAVDKTPPVNNRTSRISFSNHLGWKASCTTAYTSLSASWRSAGASALSLFDERSMIRGVFLRLRICWIRRTSRFSRYKKAKETVSLQWLIQLRLCTSWNTTTHYAI
jgi:hypothetical protein